MKKHIKILAIAALLLTALTGLKSAHAYFTTYTTANGKFTLELDDTTKIKEEFVDKTKTVTLENEGPESCFVRLRAIAPPGYEDHLTYDWEGNWYKEGEWYYFGDPIPAGGSADNIVITIHDLPKDALDGDIMNFIIMYESVAVIYDEDGNPDFDESWKGEITITNETAGGGN